MVVRGNGGRCTAMILKRDGAVRKEVAGLIRCLSSWRHQDVKRQARARQLSWLMRDPGQVPEGTYCWPDPFPTTTAPNASL